MEVQQLARSQKRKLVSRATVPILEHDTGPGAHHATVTAHDREMLQAPVRSKEDL